MENQVALSQDKSGENVPSVQAIQNVKNHTHDSVLNPQCDPMSPSGKILASQAAGMMMQDVTSFSQGMMQIMTAAIAKATAEVVATDAQKGKEALKTLSPALEKLPSFVSSMASSVQKMEGAFSGQKLPEQEGEKNESKPKEKKWFCK